MNNLPFSGSYEKDDIRFLLKVIDIRPLSTVEREYRIQSKSNHYSEMIGPESPPEEKYLKIFYEALSRNLKRLSSDLLKLSSSINIRMQNQNLESKGLVKEDLSKEALSKEELSNSFLFGPITLVSIARSGTPVGVILTRILRQIFKREVLHYGISVIRDKGIDQNALKYILSKHKDEEIVFIDGWTGKGVIARELCQSIEDFNKSHRVNLSPYLTVISDPAGAAGLSVGNDDYLIASSLLNSVVSGLISRTILNSDHIGPQDFHGCVYYDNLKPYDLSRWLIAELMNSVTKEQSSIDLKKDYGITKEEKTKAKEKCRAFMENTKIRFNITDENLIKPGLGEATRVLLRRSPELLILKNINDPDVTHALYLAKEKKVPMEEQKDLPYRACSLIKRLDLP